MQSHLSAVTTKLSPVWCVSVCPFRTVIPLASISTWCSVLKWITILLKLPRVTESSSPFTDSSGTKEHKCDHTWMVHSTQILHWSKNTSANQNRYIFFTNKIPEIQKHYQQIVLEVMKVKVLWLSDTQYRCQATRCCEMMIGLWNIVILMKPSETFRREMSLLLICQTM